MATVEVKAISCSLSTGLEKHVEATKPKPHVKKRDAKIEKDANKLIWLFVWE